MVNLGKYLAHSDYKHILETAKIAGKLGKQEKMKVYIVGGVVRDIILGKKIQDIDKYEQLIVYVTDRAGHDIRYAIDATKIANELSWTPDETFATGIRKTVEWYLENRIWCNRVKDGSYQGERLGVIK